jgi:threonyl-tRNA synthetase
VHDYAQDVARQLRAADVRVEVDTSDETVGYKIRQAETQKIPYMLVVGDREKEAGTVSVRSHEEGQQDTLSVEDFLEEIGPEFAPSLD